MKTLTESQDLTYSDETYVLSKEFPAKDSKEGSALVHVLNRELETLYSGGILPELFTTESPVTSYSFHLTTYIGNNGNSVSIWKVYLHTDKYSLMLHIEDSTEKVVLLSCLPQPTGNDSSNPPAPEEFLADMSVPPEKLSELWAKYLELEIDTDIVVHTEGQESGEKADYHGLTGDYAYTDHETTIAYAIAYYGSYGGFLITPTPYDPVSRMPAEEH